MRVLHLIPSFGSGGAERQLSIIAPAMAESGIECHVGYCYEGPNLQPLLQSPVHLHQFRVAGNYDPMLFWQVWLLIRAIRPDVVQTWLLQMDVVGGVTALLAQVPFVLSERSSSAAYPPGWKTFLRGRIGMFATSIVANSQGGMDYWKSLHVNAPVFLIRNCIAPPLRVPEIPENTPPTTDLILFAGRLSPEKNVVLLLKALIQVLVAAPKCTAIMFGEGPLQVGLCEMISDAGMNDRIRLGGYTRNLATWLSRADVCVSISEFEGNPNIVLEAAAQGCSLVLSDIPAHREIFDQSSAWFVNHKSVEDVSKGILQVLQEKGQHPTKAERAKRAVAGYTPDIILAEYLQVYSDGTSIKCRGSSKQRTA
jgi:glycosyltransferase involved in cell wall biosynthesis